MSKTIKDKFSGRGNAWLKIPIGFESASKVLNDHIANTHYDTSNYVKNVNKHGFYWVRYKKTCGEKSEFEVRFNGSTIDHKDSVITIDNNDINKLPLLGGTPKKLNLESDTPVEMASSKNIIKNKPKGKRGRKPKNEKKNLSPDELISQAFDIQHNPTFPKVNIPLPADNNKYKMIDFLKLDGVKFD